MARKKIEIVTIEVDGELVEVKKCTRCGRVKRICEYYNDNSRANGKTSACKKCILKTRTKPKKVRQNEYKTLTGLYKISVSKLKKGNDMMLYQMVNYIYSHLILNGRTSIKANEITTSLKCSRTMYSKVIRKIEPLLNARHIVVSRGLLSRTSRDGETHICPTCNVEKCTSDFRKDVNRPSEIFPYCKECERSYRIVAENKRRARKRALPDDIRCKDRDSFLSRFDYQCVLTGEENNVHLDHFIPLAWGHGGTTIENMIPLRGDLNTSKNDSNPFEWIKRKDIREQVDMDRWNATIKYLVELNGMTTKEFEEYVYWCEENKRDLTATA